MSLSANTVLVKAAITVVLALLLLVPLAMLHGLVTERALRRASAVGEIARGWGGNQAVGGPIVAIPTSGANPPGGRSPELFVLAESLAIEARLAVEEEPRRIGMYAVPVFVADVKMAGELDVAAALAELRTRHRDLTLHLERARLVLPIGDLRGVRSAVELDTTLLARPPEPAGDLPFAALAAPLRAGAELSAAPQRFAFELRLAGTGALDFLPLAAAAEVSATGNWPHPGFARGLLPLARSVDPAGFTAQWHVLAVNSGLPKYWFENDPASALVTSGAFGVNVVQPVDLYVRVERTVKYGGLFIAITFMTLFLWEHLAERRIHPIQYGLLGLALSVFYLLLLALAEHVGFGSAYALATAALSGLLGTYLAGSLGSRAAGGAAGGAFASIYGLLFLIVTAEDYALLAGALSLFAVLAAVMLLTRRLDWYRVGARELPPG